MLSKENMKLYLQKIYNFLSQLHYVVPFLAFCTGYLCLQFFMTEQIVQTPDLIGKNILQATKICSNLKLNLRIIAEKEMSDAEQGTIITQNPLQQSAIKAHQSIFIIVTKLPEPIMAPNLINKNITSIEQLCAEKGIKHRAYFLPSALPAGQCFAQMPSENNPLETKKMNSYISIGHPSQHLFPDFTNMPLQDVVHFLEDKNISFDIFYKDQKITAPYKKSFVIVYQKPLAGSFVSESNKLYVQLKVA